MSLSAIKVRENQFVFICIISIELEQDGGVWAIIVLNALICPLGENLIYNFSELFLTGVLVRFDEQAALDLHYCSI